MLHDARDPKLQGDWRIRLCPSVKLLTTWQAATNPRFNTHRVAQGGRRLNVLRNSPLEVAALACHLQDCLAVVGRMATDSEDETGYIKLKKQPILAITATPFAPNPLSRPRALQCLHRTPPARVPPMRLKQHPRHMRHLLHLLLSSSTSVPLGCRPDPGPKWSHGVSHPSTPLFCCCDLATSGPQQLKFPDSPRITQKTEESPTGSDPNSERMPTLARVGLGSEKCWAHRGARRPCPAGKNVPFPATPKPIQVSIPRTTESGRPPNPKRLWSGEFSNDPPALDLQASRAPHRTEPP